METNARLILRACISGVEPNERLLHLYKERTRTSDAGLVWGKPMSKSRLTPRIFEQGFAGVTKWGRSSRMGKTRGLSTLGVSCRSCSKGHANRYPNARGFTRGLACPSILARAPPSVARESRRRSSALEAQSARLRRARSARLTLKRARWGEPVGGGASVEPLGQGGQFGWFWGEIGVTEVLWGNWARK
jgi:hypothetical protein